MTCDLCEAAKGELRIFEDPHSIVLLHPRGAAPGHLIVMPRVHYSIMEQLSDDELRQLFRVTRLMAMSLEKGLACADLDIVVMNGPAAGQEFPHFSIQIIPRGKEDAVKLGWTAAAVGDMDAIAARLRDAAKPEAEPPKREAPGHHIRHIMRIP